MRRRNTAGSPFYADSAKRKSRAVEGYLLGTKLHDCTRDIKFYFKSENGEINFNEQGEPLFVHKESTVYLLPIYDG